MGKFAATAEHFAQCPESTEAWHPLVSRASSASNKGAPPGARIEVDGLTWPPGAARVSVWSPALLRVPAPSNAPTAAAKSETSSSEAQESSGAALASPCLVLHIQVLASHDPEAWARRKEEVPRRENKVKLYDVTWAASND